VGLRFKEKSRFGLGYGSPSLSALLSTALLESLQQFCTVEALKELQLDCDCDCCLRLKASIDYLPPWQQLDICNLFS
jgi:hypothetical protein